MKEHRCDGVMETMYCNKTVTRKCNKLLMKEDTKNITYAGKEVEVKCTKCKKLNKIVL